MRSVRCGASWRLQPIMSGFCCIWFWMSRLWTRFPTEGSQTRKSTVQFVRLLMRLWCTGMEMSEKGLYQTVRMHIPPSSKHGCSLACTIQEVARQQSSRSTRHICFQISTETTRKDFGQANALIGWNIWSSWPLFVSQSLVVFVFQGH